MIKGIFDPAVWAAVPFHFWTVVFFALGSIVGSFLNVCIHRMPLGLSVISPPSHCPHCRYSIPWFLNIPLLTWLYLRGRCANCSAPISIRYFLVELLTALLFSACWIVFGRFSPAVALVYCLFVSGLIVATFIDFEHFIIPDEITLGGMAAGFACSLLVPALHGTVSVTSALKSSLIGMGVGAGIIYFVLRIGKLLFGRHRIVLPAETPILFTETSVRLPDKEVPYEEIFYRESDAVRIEARRVEMVDRCYQNVPVKLSPSLLQVGEDEFKPEDVPYLQAISAEVVLPREAMGLGDVKFMGAIGAFLGWKAVLFALMASSTIGAAVGITTILLRRQSSRVLPYGPYIALAALIWIFGGARLVEWWFSGAGL